MAKTTQIYKNGEPEYPVTIGSAVIFVDGKNAEQKVDEWKSELYSGDSITLVPKNTNVDGGLKISYTDDALKVLNDAKEGLHIAHRTYGALAFAEDSIGIYSDTSITFESSGDLTMITPSGNKTHLHSNLLIYNGTISIVGGTANQFLKANGTLDSTAYASTTYVQNNYVSLTGRNEITGYNSFTGSYIAFEPNTWNGDSWIFLESEGSDSLSSFDSSDMQGMPVSIAFCHNTDQNNTWRIGPVTSESNYEAQDGLGISVEDVDMGDCYPVALFSESSISFYCDVIVNGDIRCNNNRIYFSDGSYIQYNPSNKTITLSSGVKLVNN